MCKARRFEEVNPSTLARAFRLHAADRILRGRCKHYPKDRRPNSGGAKREERISARKELARKLARES